jgi:diguanylate cyclase (GGDEF)-like protein
MKLPIDALDTLCPMHTVVSPTGLVLSVGPTLAKLRPNQLTGRAFLDIFEVQRPRGLGSMDALLKFSGRKLHLRFRDVPKTSFKAVMVADGKGGGIVKLSFGISLVEAVNDYSLSNKDFDPTDLSVEMLYLIEAKSIAMEATLTLNRRLQTARIAAEEQAFTDPLTGLRNRRAMDSTLSRLCATSSAFCLVHLDLDHFKAVNDTHGHAAGDHVLQETAHRMLRIIRREDTIARVGGDEFILVFEELVEPQFISDVVDRIINEIRIPIRYGAISCRISGSAGISIRISSQNASPEGMIAAADEALYKAKASGRSCHKFSETIVKPTESINDELGLEP